MAAPSGKILKKLGLHVWDTPELQGTHMGLISKWWHRWRESFRHIRVLS
jgi:hypothetical protein